VQVMIDTFFTGSSTIDRMPPRASASRWMFGIRADFVGSAIRAGSFYNDVVLLVLLDPPAQANHRKAAESAAEDRSPTAGTKIDKRD
jgi:hypothetical protein